MEREGPLDELSHRLTELERTTQLRLSALEHQVATLMPAGPTPPPPVPAIKVTPSAFRPPPPAPQARVSPPPPVTSAATGGSMSTADLDEALLRWVGVGLVAAAALFLVSAAIARGWITPELQLLGAAAAGVGLLGASVVFARRDRRQDWSLATGLGGAVVLVASAVASHEWLAAVGPAVALMLVTLAVATAVTVALSTRSDLVAASASAVALIGTSGWFPDLPRQVPVLWVVCAIVASSLVGLALRWPVTRLVTGWIGVPLLLGLCFAADDLGLGRESTIAGLALAVTVLWIGPQVAQRRTELATSSTATSSTATSSMLSSLRAESGWAPIDLRTLAVVPVVAWQGAVGVGLDPGGDGGTVAIVVALLFALASVASWFFASRLAALSTLIGASGLLSVGLALTFDGPMLMIVLAANAVASFAIGRALEDRPTRWAGYAAGLAASAVAVWHTVNAMITGGFASVGHGVSVLAIIAMWAVAAAYTHRRDGAGSTLFLASFGGAWVGLMLWLAAILLDLPQGLGLVSAVWALLAGGGVTVGLVRRLEFARIAGLATLGVTLLKLFTVDLEGVDVLARVAVFFVVGLGLIVLGRKIPNLISSGQPGARSQQPGAVG